MEPSKKSPVIEEFLDDMIGASRQETIRSNKCIPPPFGCNKQFDPDTEFNSLLEQREYAISGLCAACQWKIFGY